MRRRDFLTGLAAIANGIAPARMSNAQAPRKMVRVGIATLQPRTGPLWTAFEQRLQQLGYTEGENLAVEFIDLNGSISRESEAMKELVRRKVDILIASGTEIALKCGKVARLICQKTQEPLFLCRFAAGLISVFSSKLHVRT
jgi:putative tryptophan/tyrosine transport system substrate-binding protein